MKNEKKSTVDRVTDAGDANFPGGAPSRTPLQRRKKKGILGGLAKWDNSIGRELDRGSISKRSLGGRSIWLASAFFLSLF